MAVSSINVIDTRIRKILITRAKQTQKIEIGRMSFAIFFSIFYFIFKRERERDLRYLLAAACEYVTTCAPRSHVLPHLPRARGFREKSRERLR